MLPLEVTVLVLLLLLCWLTIRWKRNKSVSKMILHGAKLNCATGNMTVQQQCLRERHWVDVVNATTSIAPYGMEFSVPDGGFKSPANYSTKLVESKNQLKILYGINQDEFYGFERAFYYEHEKEEGEFSVHLPESITQLFGDFVFTANMVKEAKRFTSIGHKVWIYKFGYAGKLEDQYDKHVTHGADVNYAYMAIDKWRKIMNAATVSRKEANQEVRVSRNIALTLTYFIKHHGSDRKQFNSSKLNYFDIKKDNVESDQPIIKPHVLEMWERLSRQLRKKKTALEKEVTTTTLAPKDGKQAKKQKRKADYKTTITMITKTTSTDTLTTTTMTTRITRTISTKLTIIMKKILKA
uniref:Carboxylesterase type B domain-containing protein n=1 Tax=Ditylenchus dipsaci TaxID=166011 RepID=A0A915E857_9BILA